MKDATAAAVGTSLEVLAPYLPYGIQLAINIYEPEEPQLRGELIVLDADGSCSVRYRGCSTNSAVLFGEALPVLRPFSQLVEPLPDGTPLVDKLAEILFGDALEPNCELGAGFDWFGNYVATANGVLLFSISLYWHIQCANDLPAGFEAYDYLRSQHFAVGLQSSQFLPLVGGGGPSMEGGAETAS